MRSICVLLAFAETGNLKLETLPWAVLRDSVSPWSMALYTKLHAELRPERDQGQQFHTRFRHY